MNSLEILYRDPHYVAVHKPAGMLVHRSNIDRHETRFVVQCLRDQIGQWVYPVHRLDKPTSGVLIFGFSPEAARLLNEQFTANRVSKTYLAIVRGVTEPEGVIDYPLVEKLDKISDRLARRDKPAQPAVTGYRRLAKVELPFPVGRYATTRYSFLEVTPKTGRKHQIRRHMKHIFHPVVGDTTYGDGRHNRFFREHFASGRLLLTAVSMVFEHPYDGRTTVVESPPDAELRALLTNLGWGSVLDAGGRDREHP